MAMGTTEMAVRDPRASGPAGPVRDAHSGAAAPTADARAPRRSGLDRPASRPDPAPARLAIGMAGAAATTAIVAAIVGGTSAGSAAAVVVAPAAGGVSAPQADIPVRHVTQYVTIPSDATPPPRRVVYATPVPAPPQQVQQQTVVVTTTQSGRVVP